MDCPHRWSTPDGFHEHRCRGAAGHSGYHLCNGCRAREEPSEGVTEMVPGASEPIRAGSTSAAQPSSTPAHPNPERDAMIEQARREAAAEVRAQIEEERKRNRSIWTTIAVVVAIVLALIWINSGDDPNHGMEIDFDPGDCLYGAC